MSWVQFDRECSLRVENLPKTLLQLAEENKVPLMHACGGAARCSTCRVSVMDGADNLAPRTPEEQKLAEEKGFPAEMRLACQAQVKGPVTVHRLVVDETDMDEVKRESSSLCIGHEQSIAVLFSDIRDFTPFSESTLPFDIVHILNRYFTVVCQPILDNKGQIDKYMGDGVMALFGHDDPHASAQTVCNNAINAALGMQEALLGFNAYLERNFGRQFRIGVGIHYGPAIVGQMGHPEHRQYTALGDTVNTAARVESYCKTAQASFLVSETVRDNAPEQSERFAYARHFQAALKGKAQNYCLYEVSSAS